MNFKEKNKHLRDLHAPQHAQKDLALLKQIDPRNDQLPTFDHAPARNAERILYVLLDIANPEQIRNNRRAPEPGAANSNSQSLTDLQDQLDETELEKESLEDQVSELEETVENLEAELEAEKKSAVIPAQAETHETRNPKPVTRENSKKKPSTRQSGGKTSKTKTSK